MSSTSAPAADNRCFTSSITANLRLSSTWKRISGVFTIFGMSMTVIGAALPKGPFGRTFAVGVAGLVPALEDNRDEIVDQLKAMIQRLEHV